VTKEKLNLLKFASRSMAEASASATKIVRCQMVNADSFGVSLHCIPDYVGCHSSILPSTILRNSPEHLAFSHSCVVDPNIYETFTPRWHGTVRSRPPFPIMVESAKVESYMVKLAEAIDPGLITFTSAQEAAYNLSHAPQDSFVSSWGVN
jgi:hypothetical protein